MTEPVPGRGLDRPPPALGGVTIEVAIQGTEVLAAMQLGALLARATLSASDLESGMREGSGGQPFAFARTTVRHLLS